MRILTKKEAKEIDIEFIYKQGNKIVIINKTDRVKGDLK